MSDDGEVGAHRLPAPGSGADDVEPIDGRPQRADRAGWSRRRFLAATGGLGLIGATSVPESGDAAPRDPPGRAPTSAAPPLRNGALRHVVRRREDGLLLVFDFVNMRRRTNPARMERQNDQLAAHVIVHFPPQHLAEQAFFQITEPPLPSRETPRQRDPVESEELLPAPIGARLAGPSRIVFRLVDGVDSVRLEVEELLDWISWGRVRTVPTALPPGENPFANGRTPTPPSLELRPPDDLETSIELPWWLHLSPHDGAAWAHRTDPSTNAGRSELWHTRLAVATSRQGGFPFVNESDAVRRTVRAVWTDDPSFNLWIEPRQGGLGPPTTVQPPTGSLIPDVGIPFRSSLVPRDRYDIVASSADYLGFTAPDGYVPPAIQVDQLMLTAQGAWIDSQGQWSPDATGTSLEDWTQRGSHGRDHYVRVIRSGFLAGGGTCHRSSLIKVTERKFARVPGAAQPSAYLRQRIFIVVRESVKRYAGAQPFAPFGGRRLPFARVELLTVITPDLDEPEPFTKGDNSIDAQRVFVPTVAGSAFRFQARFTDLAGRDHDITLPLVFVDFEDAGIQSQMSKLRNAFNSDDPAGSNGVTEPAVLSHDFGARIALAPPTETGGDDTTLDVTTMRWALDLPVGFPPPTPNGDVFEPLFSPAMQRADVRLAAAEELAGAELDPTTVVLDEAYLENGIDGFDGDIFVSVENPDTPTVLGYGSTGNGDRVGGAIEPAIGITAVSRANGVVGGSNLETLRAGSFSPAEFFGLQGASLLGGIPLADVLDPVSESLDAAPILDQRIIRDGAGRPVASETRLEWASRLQSVSPGGATNLFRAVTDDERALVLRAYRYTDFADPTKTTAEVLGELRGFEINLFGDGTSALGFIGVQFDRLSFLSKNGAKPQVTADVDLVDFRPPLAFVKKFDSFLQSTGLGGLSIDVEPTAVIVGYSIEIPSVEVGVLSCQNIALGLGLTIPFTAEPVRLRFFFSTREDPFLLTVSALGGGGFFGLALGADGVEMVEAALEVGAEIGLNLGVASGKVYAKLGLYFKVWASDDGSEEVRLTGYTRLGGEIRVMGIASVSVEFYLAFTYEPPSKVTGQATLVVEVKVLGIGGSYELTVERRYGGSADPTFGELMDAGEWAEYAGAFA